jgi:hypothetical protein
MRSITLDSRISSKADLSFKPNKESYIANTLSEVAEDGVITATIHAPLYVAFIFSLLIIKNSHRPHCSFVGLFVPIQPNSCMN